MYRLSTTYTLIIACYVFFIGTSFLLQENVISPVDSIVDFLPLLFLVIPVLALFVLLLVMNNKYKEDKHEQIGKLIWLLILIVGLSSILAEYYIDRFLPLISKGQKKIGFGDFFYLLVQNEGYDLLAVVFLAVITGFVTHISQSWKTFLEDAKKVREELKTLLGEAKAQGERLKGIKSITEETLPILKKMYGISSRFLAVTGHYLELKTEAERNKDREIIICLEEAMANVGDNASKILIKYLDKTAYAERTLATHFMAEFLKLLPKGDPALNRVPANFGIMASIVGDLYDASDALYKQYKKPIVYFTTLTMPLENWFDPVGKADFVSSIALLWYQSIDHWEHKIEAFRSKSDKIKFIRCYLCLPDRTGDTPISCEGVVYCKTLKKSYAEGLVLVNKSGEYAKAKQGLAQITAHKSDVGNGLGPYGEEQYSYKPIVDEFRRRFHPIADNLKCLRLTRQIVDELFQIKEIAQYFAKLKSNVAEIKKAVAERNDKQWLDAFYNENIPPDLFAIGVENDGAVDWKCCLSGFIGGDYYRMTLGWDDQFISKDKGRWPALKKYIEYIYTKSTIFNCDASCKEQTA